MTPSTSSTATASTMVAESDSKDAVPQHAYIARNAIAPRATSNHATHASMLETEKDGQNANGFIDASRSAVDDSVTVMAEKTQQHQDNSRGKDAEAMVALTSSFLFPPLPTYGPPSFVSHMKATVFRITAFFLSLTFLGFIVTASLVTGIPRSAKKLSYKLTLRDVNKLRPHHGEECRRADVRRRKQKEWEHRSSAEKIESDQEGSAEDFPPTEGGKDRIICDVAYYARRVGLDVDFFQVRTEDGFLIDLWHVYDPKEYISYTDTETAENPAHVKGPRKALKPGVQKPKFPVLLIHGLLQSSGAYCCNDDESLAFWLCKSGFDVWLGNNRCGFNPRHESFKYSDPRMWSWTIQHMGIYDLPALASQVLFETGFQKLGLICHSQGTAQTLVALSKDQRPELGQKLTVFCALAPAAYAGPLINKYYFQLIRKLSPFTYELAFGIHAFIPFMMQMHSFLHPSLYGWLGYKVFSFLFNWSDSRWDRGLRNRLFQFAPVYVSSETMRWWLGKDGFASNKCILSTKDIVQYEGEMDSVGSRMTMKAGIEKKFGHTNDSEPSPTRRHNVPASTPWYNEQVPPFAMWVCGNDELVDGNRLLRRLQNGREPHVKMVHSKVIGQYEHLDVIWAIDAVEQVFEEMRGVLWKTCYDHERFRVPKGCDGDKCIDL
ncbi:hypothetical protein EsHS_00002800 [Epichloe bromicola]